MSRALLVLLLALAVVPAATGSVRLYGGARPQVEHTYGPPRLVDRGLARRVPHPTDGRSYRLELTARGERMTQEADPVLAECYAVVERLLPKPLAAYQAAVEELNLALEQALAEIEAPSRPGDAR
jgi:hypothetical protein